MEILFLTPPSLLGMDEARNLYTQKKTSLPSPLFPLLPLLSPGVRFPFEEYAPMPSFFSPPFYGEKCGRREISQAQNRSPHPLPPPSRSEGEKGAGKDAGPVPL